MRATILAALILSCIGICQAQTATPTPTPAAPKGNSASTGTGEIEKRTERIRIDEGGARIDEVRVGGETQSITVQPKDGLPSYKVDQGNTTDTPRTSTQWKLLDF